MKIKNAMIGISLVICSLSSQAAVITFDEPNIPALVDDFYAGGGGPNLGAIFTTGDWSISTGFGQTSQPNFSFSNTGLGSFTLSTGFTGLVSFNYGAFVDSVVSIFDGADGTGNLLASITLLANNPNNAFDPVSISFSGTAHSIAVLSSSATFGWDDLAFNESAAVPEPGSLALLGLGLAGLAGLRRKLA